MHLSQNTFLTVSKAMCKNSYHLILVSLGTEPKSASSTTRVEMFYGSLLWEVNKFTGNRIANYHRFVIMWITQAKQAIARVNNLVLVIFHIQLQTVVSPCLIIFFLNNHFKVAQWKSKFGTEFDLDSTGTSTLVLWRIAIAVKLELKIIARAAQDKAFLIGL